MLKKYYKKIGKKQDNDVDVDIAQLERSNNKCYTLVFKYIYIYIDEFSLPQGDDSRDDTLFSHLHHI